MAEPSVARASDSHPRLRPIRHGLYGTPEYLAWRSMRIRCLNPRAKNYSNYGGRGITICAEWDSFPRFYADMGPRPGVGYSLDRIDNMGNYTPQNCRWATTAMQARNRRSNTFLTHDGKTMTIADWARASGLAVNTLISRLFHAKWPMDVALTRRIQRGAPIRPRKRPSKR